MHLHACQGGGGGKAGCSCTAGRQGWLAARTAKGVKGGRTPGRHLPTHTAVHSTAPATL